MFNFLKSLISNTPTVDLAAIIARKPFLVDVRKPEEFSSGHPKGAVNIPLDEIATNIEKFKTKKEIVVFCRSGNRSNQAKNILQSHGIANVIDAQTWKNVAQYTG